MTLFGSPAPAPRTLTITPSAAVADEPAPEIPAFERRAQLRSERHRLVSDLRRIEGSSHREINAWLNRKLGIASVENATLEQLERSVELLVGKLTSKR
jgi:hypothetical protein